MSGSKLMPLVFPVAGMAGTLLFCAFILHGGDILMPTAQADEEIASVLDAG